MHSGLQNSWGEDTLPNLCHLLSHQPQHPKYCKTSLEYISLNFWF